MPWNTKCEFIQRCRFIQQIRGRKATVAQLCRRWSVSRKTAYKWLNRYLKYGSGGLRNRPPTAKKHGRKIGQRWRRRARQMRRRHRSWGTSQAAPSTEASLWYQGCALPSDFGTMAAAMESHCDASAADSHRSYSPSPSAQTSHGPQRRVDC